MSHSRKPSVGPYERHPEYYIDSADLHIVSGRTLFRVHSYFFSRESPIFSRKINPASPGDIREGTTDKDPVFVDGVAPEDFEQLLWVFYNPRYSLYQKSVEEWRIILNLADKFVFPEVKDLGVRELQKKSKAELPLIDKMALYEKYKVDPRHLVPLYAELCERDEPLALSEAKILGLEATLLVSNAREKLRANPSGEGRSPLPEGMETGDVFRAVERELGVREGATEEFRTEYGFTNSSPPAPSSPERRSPYVNRFPNGSPARNGKNARSIR